MVAHVYCLMQTQERVWENLKVYVNSSRKRGLIDISILSNLTKLSLVFALYRLYKHRASIFYFFHKIRLGNMLSHHNRVCIA